MAIRTTDEAVRGIIETTESINTAPFIRAANALTDYLESEDADLDSVLTAHLLVQIETYLAAHFYARRDPQYRSRATSKAKAKFQGISSGPRLESTDWGQDAMVLDVSGILAQINKGRRTVGVAWLGLPPSDQTDYADRD